jgi:hypothetical protein
VILKPKSKPSSILQHQRYQSLNNVTPSGDTGVTKAILQQRERTKQKKTLETRRLHHRQRAA